MGGSALFKTRDGRPYLEAHHIRRLIHLSNHFDPILGFEKGAQTPSHDFVVVDEEDPQRSLRFGMHRSTVPHHTTMAAGPNGPAADA
ncbi:MAG: hypothetical protein IH789_13770 [Acidobacteria bacterium]|nr:hypothetical protein [Acidobacteriota bacterium]